MVDSPKERLEGVYGTETSKATFIDEIPVWEGSSSG
jgi:hypothetical protein